MRQNPYNKIPTPIRQMAKVRVTTQDFDADYVVICFNNDEDEVLHTKAKKLARANFGSQLDEQELEYEILGRENLKN